MTYLAVPIAAKKLGEAQEQIKAAVDAGAEMLELRTDYLVHLSVGLARQVIGAARELAPGLPIIVTCRDYHQGGALRHSNELRTNVLTTAIRAGAEYVDVEYQNFLSEAVGGKISMALSIRKDARLILSAHNFQTKFSDIRKLHSDILSMHPGAIAKAVYSAHHINDCFDVLDLLGEAKGDTISFCMDEAGFVTRILAKKLGGFVTFGCIDRSAETAPGQPTVAELKDIYRWDSTGAETELYGVIGSPLGHSLSPVIHNASFAEADLNKLYLPLLVGGGREEFNAFMENILSRPWLGFRGFSITIPHKENALSYVKSKKGVVDPLAERIGAANTIVIGDKQLSIYNTDCGAALDAITSGLGIERAGLKKMPVAVVGAGGVSRAIVAGLAEAKAKVKIYNRTVERAKKLSHEFKCDYAPLAELKKLKAQLVINCTSIGMHPDTGQTPVGASFLKKDIAVFDTVYNPAETLLLKQAKELGCKTISGVDMFVNQAAEQFKLFTGQDASSELMRRIISDSFRQG